jgi:AcrR family transcriptional regulator
MKSRKWYAPQPRKLPRQTRAANTIEAVLEAAVQILIAEGSRGLTTTRVAKRSGFAVGTLYQYFANKDELIDTLVHRHIEYVVACVQLACCGQQGAHLGDMINAVADAFFAANIEKARDVRAIHLAWMRIERSELLCVAFARLRESTTSMLASSPRLEAAEIDMLAYKLVSILIGTTRSIFEQGMDEALTTGARERIVSVGAGYTDIACIDSLSDVNAET